jgi:hypothetical protein
VWASLVSQTPGRTVLRFKDMPRTSPYASIRLELTFKLRSISAWVEFRTRSERLFEPKFVN